ncbi:hypothetical protein AALP_AA2G193600 [Arabis alpina]|uniref:Uncharacterized protein n=1 Tax=Arabis alpina TaxID=50452 RepID=A0A087HIK4_ARAAL|nr:hypothetical protein AALP_AA2G193600 [Arabis alpina]
MAFFKWQDKEHQLLMLRARKDRELKPAAWWVEDEDTKDIVGGRDENTGGTLFGCSKQGRVALLVNVKGPMPSSNAGAELLTVKFLKGKMTPEEFANELERDKTSGLAFDFVVADIHSKIMFYISKKTQNKEVDAIKKVVPGSYCISPNGMHDLSRPENERYKDAFSVVSTAVSSMNANLRSGGKVMVTETSNNGSATLDVESTGKANFFETYVEDGEYKFRKFDFDIE